jgi:hypothetical protein
MLSDRAFRIALSRLWSRWTDVLVIVKPDTVTPFGASPSRAKTRSAPAGGFCHIRVTG